MIARLAALLAAAALAVPAAGARAASDCRHPREDDLVLDTLYRIPEGFEPIDLEILPDGLMLLASRYGQVVRLDSDGGDPRVVLDLEVFGEVAGTTYASTLGILGIVQSPNFHGDRRIYVYYTPQTPTPTYRLSRFGFDGDGLRDERVLLEIPRDRLHRDHSGGSMAFDAEGNLYLSTGDNSLASASSGFSPIDNGSNANYNDARRSAGNTADLRGKILRIRPIPFSDSDPPPQPGPGSTYTIPSGNLREAYATLWPMDTSRSRVREEIYVMGVRNPFRIAVDRSRGWLHWGDIGPDAAASSETRGPLGHDEWNVARSPGNYGWPFFVGPNLPYRQFDFDLNLPGDFFDPAAPENASRRNTGVSRLPPARGPVVTLDKAGKLATFPPSEKAFYPWGWSAAAVGGVFYDTALVDPQRRSGAFPAYYHGKLFVADHIHRWIQVLALDDTAGFVDAEQFVRDRSFTRILDLNFSRDGRLYVLEWGNTYQPNDAQSRITRVSYIGGDFACPTPTRIKGRKGQLLHVVDAGNRLLRVPPWATAVSYWSLDGRLLATTRISGPGSPAGRVRLPAGFSPADLVLVEFHRRP